MSAKIRLPVHVLRFQREREEGGERVVLPQGVIRFVMIMK